MAVQPQRTTWTDERLDDHAQSVRDGFNRTDAEIRLVRKEMREGFSRVDDRFDALQNTLSGQISRLQLTIIAGLIAIVGAMIGNDLGIF